MINIFWDCIKNRELCKLDLSKKDLLFGYLFCTLSVMHTHKQIITNSIAQMMADPKIVRITFVTTFFHSLIVTLLIILNVNKLFMQYAQTDSDDLGRVPQFLIQQLNSHQVGLIFIVATIILFLLYSVIYPIGQAAVIHYLHNKKWIRDSIRASWAHFYPMFEFWFVSAIFSAVTYFFLAFKIFVLDWSRSIPLILVFVVWWLFMSRFNTLKIYTRYFITLHNLPLYDSIKNSIKIVSGAYKTTNKYMRMQTWLLINFSLNLVLIIGLPILIIHFAILYNAISFWYVKMFVYLLFFVLVIGSAYMSSFIRAFFAYYRYEIFMRVAPPKI